MPWFGLWSKETNNEGQKGIADDIVTEAQTIARATQNKISSEVHKLDGSNANDSISSALSSPATLISTAILTTATLTLFTFQRRHLRRVPNVAALPQDFILPFKKRFTRSLFGRVTSVGDADNFRLFHTPLGRLAAWDWLRRTPSGKALKDKTVHIRLAGIDAPELSHFGRPAQPYSKEALDWLTKYVMGRRVRCYVHKADQYGRVVATVYVRKGLLRRDVGLQMLKVGYATMYEAKTGGEFGGPSTEERYKKMEQWAITKRKGMWADKAKLESPREYKERYREGNKEK